MTIDEFEDLNDGLEVATSTNFVELLEEWWKAVHRDAIASLMSRPYKEEG